MEQAKYYPCDSCQTPIEPGFKFCGRCGGPTPADVLEPAIDYFSDLQDPAKASLVVVRGEEGLSYHLRALEHVVGRPGAPIPLDDPFVSPRHANLFYRGTELHLRDENSDNGTYIRIRKKTKLAPGDTFIAGDQVFRVEPMPQTVDHTDAQGTYFYGSPTYSSKFRVVQLIEGGSVGYAHCPRGQKVTIGRRGCDVNLHDDKYLSLEHCAIEQDEDGFSLTDLDSKNGTYVRIKRDHRLDHGDYFALGRKVLRIDMNA
jgi:pSer/pThr/pTyr-binding forkhead associated (FHA) protein